MERLIVHELDRTRNGGKIVKNYFINDKKENVMKRTHSYFTKEQKKQAKLNSKS